MNFGETIKNEIVNKPIKDEVYKKAFLSGAIRGCGTIFLQDGEYGFELKVGEENAAMLLTDYFKEVFGYDVREIAVLQDKLNKKDKFILTFTGNFALKILAETGIIAENNGVVYVSNDLSKHIANDESWAKAFLRGIFISSGSCSVPDNARDKKTGYHLQIVFSHSASASMISDLLLKYGFSTKITRNRENYILYIKSAEEIKDFLAFIAVPVSVLKITELMVNRDFVNDINRRKNCDLGNVNRQLDATLKQTEAIKKIITFKGMDYLKEDLKTVAQARLDYPDDSITELSKRLNLSKSCINHRFRKIIEYAKEIKG